jgi:adenine phosphoribosyltransferase
MSIAPTNTPLPENQKLIIAVLSNNVDKITGVQRALTAFWPSTTLIVLAKTSGDKTARPAQPEQKDALRCLKDRYAEVYGNGPVVDADVVVAVENCIDRETKMDFCNVALYTIDGRCVGVGKSYGLRVPEEMWVKYGNSDPAVLSVGQVWNPANPSSWMNEFHSISREKQVEIATGAALFRLLSIGNTDSFKQHVRQYPNFPVQGITFRTIRGLYTQPQFLECFERMIKIAFAHVDYFAGADSRGFTVGAFASAWLKKPFIECFKLTKMPQGSFDSCTYDLEYGSGSSMGIELGSIPEIARGKTVVLCDDTVATGGTIKAMRTLMEKQGLRVVGVLAVNAFTPLIQDACKKIGEDVPVFTVIAPEVAGW